MATDYQEFDVIMGLTLIDGITYDAHATAEVRIETDYRPGCRYGYPENWTPDEETVTYEITALNELTVYYGEDDTEIDPTTIPPVHLAKIIKNLQNIAEHEAHNL